MRGYRSLSAAVFAVVFCALLGGFYGRSALVAQDQIADQYRVFTAALGAIETNYVGEVEADRLVYGAISGMLQTLDPHSSFMDPRSYAQMRERQEGQVLRPWHFHPGGRRRDYRLSPSSRGLRPTRKASVAATSSRESKARTPKGWTSEQAVRQLRGPRGTPVRISISGAATRS